jgi:UDP-N-acetylglucosamine transferase subunit ALG13
MIFIALGSQKFQFNRLLKKVDELLEAGIIQEEVIAQIGYSNYLPINYAFHNFLNQDEFEDAVQRSDIVIAHGGTGVIISAVKEGKKVIAVPRLKEYGEHVDDHQLQVIKQFDEMGLIEACYDVDYIGKQYGEINNREFRMYNSSTCAIIDSIDAFIDNVLLKN